MEPSYGIENALTSYMMLWALLAFLRPRHRGFQAMVRAATAAAGVLATLAWLHSDHQWSLLNAVLSAGCAAVWARGVWTLMLIQAREEAFLLELDGLVRDVLKLTPENMVH